MLRAAVVSQCGPLYHTCSYAAGSISVRSSHQNQRAEPSPALPLTLPPAHQYLAVGPVLAGQADPHPLVIPVRLARLPARLPRPVS